MRLLVTLSDPAAAARFGTYLRSIGIRNEVESDDARALIWIERDEDLDRARAELAVFQTSPSDPRFLLAADAAREIEAAEARAAQKRRARYVDVRTAWNAPQVGSTPVGLALIAASIMVAIFTQMGSNDDRGIIDRLLFQTRERAYAELISDPVSPELAGDIEQVRWRLRHPDMFSSVLSGEVWRIFTPMFIHFSALHLIFNMYWLWSFAQAIEIRKGSGTFALLVLVTALVSHSAEAGWAMANVFGQPMGYARFGGMSGVNYGLFGYLWMKGTLQPYEQMGLSKDTITILLFWLVLCMTGMVGNIANAAHVGGLLAGMAFVAVPHGIRRFRGLV